MVFIGFKEIFKRYVSCYSLGPTLGSSFRAYKLEAVSKPFDDSILAIFSKVLNEAKRQKL